MTTPTTVMIHLLSIDCRLIEGNDPRRRLVMINVRNEGRRKKPPTNVAHGRRYLWEKSAFLLNNYSFFPFGNYLLPS